MDSLDHPFRHLNLDQLRTFVVVAEELHFGRAARRLHMAASPVSRKIKELESAMGIPLFERDTRHVQLSPAGGELLPMVRDLILKLDDLRWMLPREDLPTTAPIRVGISPGTHPNDRRLLFDAVRSSHEDCRLLPEVGTSVPLLSKLRSGELLCTTLHRPVSDTDVGTLLLSEDELGVVVSASHPLATQDRLSVSSLRSLRFITLRQQPEPEFASSQRTLLEAVGIRDLVYIQSDFLSDVGTTVANTDYFTLTPLSTDSPLNRPFTDPGLVVLPCPELGMKIGTVAVWLEGRARVDPRLAATIAQLRRSVAADRP
ncbi:MAG: LysR family transcriptional regulator [Frankiales bacterium]|nr:LysR family transcriptional regulator [Frankiales bacterium]